MVLCRAKGSRQTAFRELSTSRQERKNQQMWKPNQPGNSSPTPSNEPVRPAAPATTPNYEAARPAASTSTPGAPATGEQATIGKSLVIKGEVTGSESLYIDGKVEGSINLAGNRVTVGRNGQVAANISAREIVVLGKVRGNVSASDRVDIRSEGSLTGDVTAQRISIEDGAFFKGGIDIRKPGSDKADGKLNSSVSAETPKVATAHA
jgi:cytoskeletal protein CcmA (bactofilin family)